MRRQTREQVKLKEEFISMGKKYTTSRFPNLVVSFEKGGARNPHLSGEPPHDRKLMVVPQRNHPRSKKGGGSSSIRKAQDEVTGRFEAHRPMAGNNGKRVKRASPELIWTRSKGREFSTLMPIKVAVLPTHQSNAGLTSHKVA